MKEIRGEAKNLRALLGDTKFAIDYYQREYRWMTKQVSELIGDLGSKFLESHEPENDRSEISRYVHYFLGSIIISDKNNHKYIIDGQQRLTTLTLLLIHIYHRLDNAEDKAQLSNLIFSRKFGKRSFNLNIREREACMNALFQNRPFDENGEPESIVNIVSRFQDISEEFPSEIGEKALPYFADWLIENVHLVEITAYSDADAYTIFETMNDRGLSLAPTDMLKGYLLANIKDTDSRNNANVIWRKQIEMLHELGKEEDADAIKAWLRSQHAKNIRERKKGAEPQDFDLIGTEFHRWVRSQRHELGLTESEAFAKFILEDFAFYARQYHRIRSAAEELTDGLEAIFYNAQNNFTLQYPVLLSPLRRGDSEAEIQQKLRIVSIYLDILIARRIWNYRAIGYSTMQYAMFLVMRDIRGKGASELTELLKNRLEDIEPFDNPEYPFGLHGTNGRQIRRLLARITNYVEMQSGQTDRYYEYIARGKNGYEIEHIWANHPERHEDEFNHPDNFREYRNRIGGLLLLPKSFNASYGDMIYDEKHKHYLKQNLLAQSLHEEAYKCNPGFQKFYTQSGLQFQPHPEFKKTDLDARQKLYLSLAEKIWSSENLLP